MSLHRFFSLPSTNRVKLNVRVDPVPSPPYSPPTYTTTSSHPYSPFVTVSTVDIEEWEKISSTTVHPFLGTFEFCQNTYILFSGEMVYNTKKFLLKRYNKVKKNSLSTLFITVRVEQRTSNST